jgi:hypothetical protein
MEKRAPGFDAYVAYETEAALRTGLHNSARSCIVCITANMPAPPTKPAEHWRTAKEIDELVELRLKRQQVITTRQPKPLDLFAVTHETSLRQVVGSSDHERST